MQYSLKFVKTFIVKQFNNSANKILILRSIEKWFELCFFAWRDVKYIILLIMNMNKYRYYNTIFDKIKIIKSNFVRNVHKNTEISNVIKTADLHSSANKQNGRKFFSFWKHSE